MLDPELPDVGVKLANRIEDLKQSARNSYHAIPTSEEERAADVRDLAEAIAAGDSSLCGYLAGLLRPEDANLAEVLAKAAIGQGGARHQFVRDIVGVIPDPAFVPALRSWSEEDMDSGTIKALADCGGVEVAVGLLVARLQEPLPADDQAELSKEIVLRATLLSALVDSDAVDIVRPYVRASFSPQETESPCLPAFRAALRVEDASIRQARFGLVLTFTKADPRNALPILIDEYRRDIMGQSILAILLHHLGDNRGQGYLNELSTGRHEPTRTQEQLSFEAIRTMANPSLDELVLDRFRRSGLSGVEFWYYDSVFIDRLGAPLLRLLLVALNEPATSPGALTVCEHYLAQDFEYDELDPRVVRESALSTCRDAIRRRLADLQSR